MKFRIKEICKDKGVTITELAAKIKIQQESMSRIITKNTTSTVNLEKIADALGVPITELFEKSNADVFRCPKCGTTLQVVSPSFDENQTGKN
jgi:transcriptional regulator with XRE-family HTH domain